MLFCLGLSFHTTRALPERDNRENLTERVAPGKQIREQNNGIGCHTLMAEGAYFAPGLGNVYERRARTPASPPEQRLRHRAWTRETGEDTPDIRHWQWADDDAPS